MSDDGQREASSTEASRAAASGEASEEPESSRPAMRRTARISELGTEEQARLPHENGARSASHPLVARSLPRPNPADFSISLRARLGGDRPSLQPGERRQRMRGFEDQYTDIIDFIVRATHRVWEEKQIGYIYDIYHHNARVIGDSNVPIFRDEVVEGTIQYINAFPDFRGYPDEIVWAGDDEVGFYTSHRAILTGHNTGYSRYGPPSGRRANVWVIANCVSLENQIFEEWVLYNTSSLLNQLGYNVLEKAREFANRATGNSSIARPFGEPERLPGQGKPLPWPRRSPERFDVEDFVHHFYHAIWNWRLVGKVDEAYAVGLRFHGPTDREYYGRGEYKSFILSIMTMFPDLALSLDEVYWMGNEEDGYVTSVRWSIVGTHRGHGIYGAPTGRRIDMWGITQHSIRHGRIHQEWMLFNEFEVMQQILRDG